MPCHRENASTSSSTDWRRRCERKSKSSPKACHLRKFVRSFTVSRTPPQSPRRIPPRQQRRAPRNGTSNGINAFNYSGCGHGGGGGCGRGRGGSGQQRGWPQQQQQFQGNPGMYLIQQQQLLPPPSMLLPPQMTGGGGGGQCPPPTMPWGPPLGQQQQPPPAQSPAGQQPSPCGQPGTFVVDPNFNQFGGDVRRLQLVAFSAVGTGHSPGGSASTHFHPFALLRDERRRHHLYGQINTINALGPAADRTRPTLLVQLGRTTIEALVDTGASATVINTKTFAQVADKDKVRLDTHADQLGLTGATKHPLEITGVYKIRMNIPEISAVSSVVIVVRNISWPLILGMDLLQIYGANVDARNMHVTWAPAGPTKEEK